MCPQLRSLQNVNTSGIKKKNTLVWVLSTFQLVKVILTTEYPLVKSIMQTNTAAIFDTAPYTLLGRLVLTSVVNYRNSGVA